MKDKLIVTTLLATTVYSALANANEVKTESKPEIEKCYGVGKAGQNDCAAKDKSFSCATHSKKDGDENSWIYVPKGLCDKLVGGKKANDR